VLKVDSTTLIYISINRKQYTLLTTGYRNAVASDSGGHCLSHRPEQNVPRIHSRFTPMLTG